MRSMFHHAEMSDLPAAEPGPIVLETTFLSDPKFVLRSYRACHRRVVVTRSVVTAAIVAFGVLTRTVLVVALGLAYFAYVEVWVRRQLRPYLKGPRSVTIVMTETEYRTQVSDRATARTWSTFQSARRRGDFWVLRISNAAAMAFPVSALDGGQHATFTNLMRRHQLLRP